MTSFEWAAVLGAAAWIPQVLGWFSRWLTKPRVRIIPGRAPEIGYTSLGPICNFPCAISADGKDAILSRVSARLTHSNGRVLEFQWTTLNETFSQVKGPEGVAEVSKNQPAIALKVSTLVLTEKQIGMQEKGFELDSRPFATALVDVLEHLKKTEPDQYLNLVFKSKEYAAAVEFAEKRFPWQEGRYQVRTEVQIVGVAEPAIQNFAFFLTSAEASRLRGNLKEIENYISDLLTGATGDDVKTGRWYWAYPLFEQAQ